MSVGKGLEGRLELADRFVTYSDIYSMTPRTDKQLRFSANISALTLQLIITERNHDAGHVPGTLPGLLHPKSQDGPYGRRNRKSDIVGVSHKTRTQHNTKQRLDSLLKREQIKGSKPCAIATAELLLRFVSITRASEPARLIQKVQDVGRRLVAAQPRELVVGNIIRRVLGLIRDEEDDSKGESDLSSLGSDAGSRPHTPQTDTSPLGVSFSPPSIAPRRDFSEPFPSNRPPLLSQHTGAHGRPPVTSMFSILAHPSMATPGSSSPAARSGTATPSMAASFGASTDFREEVKQGIMEIIDELTQSDEQIANYALEHIHPTEIIFTYSASLTVQRFLLKAASKRKFTLIHAEAYPNHHQKSYALATGRIDSEGDELDAESFQKPLISAGITVVVIPDSAMFAVMSRVNKVVLGAHAVLSNGSVVAAAGTKTVAKAARYHHVPVLVLAGTYKLSLKYPHDASIFVEYGNVEKVVKFQNGAMKLPNIEISNPIYDLVDANDIDLFVTNLGGVTSGYLYRVVREQYREEDGKL